MREGREWGGGRVRELEWERGESGDEGGERVGMGEGDGGRVRVGMGEGDGEG